MIHLSRFIIGIRHNRLFRMKTLSGELVDKLLKTFPDKFSRVAETQPNDESILSNSNDTLLVRFNRDDIIFEFRKIFDFEPRRYIEVNKDELTKMTVQFMPIFSECLKLNDDFMRIGIVYEFRVPKWESLGDKKFGAFIAENFINFKTEGEINEGVVRLSYKLRVPGGGLIKKLEDYRNIIMRIQESTGINENGKEEECLFVSADIQRIFKPLQKSIDINEHYSFAVEHLKSIILPFFKTKSIEINYE